MMWGERQEHMSGVVLQENNDFSGEMILEMHIVVFSS